MRRAVSAGIVVLVSALASGGCAHMEHGIATSSAEQMLEQMDGVRSASVTYRSVVQSTQTDPVLKIQVRMEDGVAISRPAALAEYVARVGWSAGDKVPTGGISISIVTTPQLAFGQALLEDGWSGVLFNGTDRDRFSLGYVKTTSRWGKWPAAAPETLVKTP